jgi:multiple sugar transport system substrate-binding protein
MRGLIKTLIGACALAGMLVAPAAAQTVLRIAYPGWDSKEQEREVTAIFKAFEQANPGTRIELISIPFPVMKQKLVVSLRSADAPDLAYIDSRWIPEMQAAGFLADLTGRVATLDKADWHAASWLPATVAGKVYAVPDRIDPWMVYYNTDLFKAAGVSEFPKTMDDLVEAGKKITKGGVYAWGLIGANDATFIGRYLNFLYAFHGNLLGPDGKKAAVNDANGVAALTFYTDLLNKHAIAQPSAVGNGHNDVRQLFLTKQVAMIIDGPWARGTLREMAPSLNWSVGRIPAAPGKAPRFTTTTWNYVVFDGGQNKDAAWKLIEFLVRPENQARSVVTLPARQSAARTARFAAAEFEPWLAALPHGQPFPITDRFSEIADIVGNSVQEALAKRKSPQQAADDAAARINKLF